MKTLSGGSKTRYPCLQEERVVGPTTTRNVHPHQPYLLLALGASTSAGKVTMAFAKKNRISHNIIQTLGPASEPVRARPRGAMTFVAPPTVRVCGGVCDACYYVHADIMRDSPPHTRTPKPHTTRRLRWSATRPQGRAATCTWRPTSPHPTPANPRSRLSLRLHDSKTWVVIFSHSL